MKRKEIFTCQIDLFSVMRATKYTFIWRRFNIASVFALFYVSLMYTKSKELVAFSNGTNVKKQLQYIDLFCFKNEIYSPHPNFIDHLATIRLDDEKFNQYPPTIIILETAKILFKTVNLFLLNIFHNLCLKAQIKYEQHINHSALLYEQYAIQYFQVAKKYIKNR